LEDRWLITRTTTISRSFADERKCVMNKGEPPLLSGSNTSLFLVGKDSHGNWVVQDQSGLCGGLFVDRAEALKFAMFENGHRPQAVIMVPGILELDMSTEPRTGRRSNAQALSSEWLTPSLVLRAGSRTLVRRRGQWGGYLARL
jgi:hypothetical protein